MIHLPNLLKGSVLHNCSGFNYFPSNPLLLLQPKSLSYQYTEKYCPFQTYQGLQFSLQGSWEVAEHAETCSLPDQVEFCHGAGLEPFPNIQTLKKFPKKELFRKVVVVRFDSTILLREEQDQQSLSVTSAFSTIKYLHEAGAKVILASNWNPKVNSKLLTAENATECLSSVLQLKVVPMDFVSRQMQSIIEDREDSNILLLENLSQVKEELANCSKFAELLSSGVDIFVNDAFSQSHKILASTVGIACFCYPCVAGFHFMDCLHQLKEIVISNKKPYVAIIGGGNLLKKAAALHFLASKCDGLVFVGNMAFQIMHVLGLAVPTKLVEHGALEEALNIIRLANSRSIPILFPKDFWCKNNGLPAQLEIFPANCILDGWQPVDFGPSSLEAITTLLSRCEKIIWLGPAKFSLSNQEIDGESKLAQVLGKLSQKNCEITVVGNAACKALIRETRSVSSCNVIENASVVWEFFKRRRLPALMALDRAYSFEANWAAAYTVPTQPLVVDIGSGNGLFLFNMATRRTDLNFLGLEKNGKLVSRCLDSVHHQSGIKNRYFIATNATSTFRSIVSTYPGELVLVSIQCPNPDFNKPEHRWRMLQRSLVEAISDLLTSDGKVFLQSDIEAVAVRMKEQFLKYGKGKLAILHDQENAKINGGGWLKENPFGIPSDWERHVIDRGDPMYRSLLSKVRNSE